MNRNSRASSVFSLAASLLVVLVLATANARYFLSGSRLNDWDDLESRVILAYLAFITLRTIGLIIFSFADRFFHPEFREARRKPMVSILVPCFNEEVVISHAIDTLLRIDYPNFEILVIDDGSTDSTLLAAKAREAKHKVRIIHQKNQGKATALNRGLGEALGELILCVDADGGIQPDALNWGVPFFEGDPRLAAVAGNVTIGNTRGVIGLFQRLEYSSGLNIHKAAQSFLGVVSIVPGPVGLFRKAMVMQIGGYRTDNFAEDCDLTIRLLMAGKRVVYCSKMVAVTEAPEDFASLLKQRYRWARGTIQAIKLNARWLFRPFQSPRNFLILAYFTLETLLLPTANFICAVALIQQFTLTGDSLLMGPFFLQLILLNFGITTYAVCLERQPLSLIVLSLANPLTYGLAMELLRFVSLFDELIGLPMSWNKLNRTGNLEGEAEKKT